MNARALYANNSPTWGTCHTTLRLKLVDLLLLQCDPNMSLARF